MSYMANQQHPANEQTGAAEVEGSGWCGDSDDVLHNQTDCLLISNYTSPRASGSEHTIAIQSFT